MSSSALLLFTVVYTHFNQPDQSINDILLIPLERIHNNGDSVRKAREAHLIDKAMTLEPKGILPFSIYRERPTFFRVVTRLHLLLVLRA